MLLIFFLFLQAFPLCIFTPSSVCEKTSTVFLLCGRPAGLDIVNDFTGSGGGLFALLPPPVETIELKECEETQIIIS